MEFVNRERELITLNRLLDEVRGGEGRVVLIEGPAGIGKTQLLEHFLDNLGNIQILRSRGEPSSRYVPYQVVSQALEEYGSLREIRKNEWKRRISEIADKISRGNKMVFVDEIGYGGGYRIYKKLREKINGIYFTIRVPRRGDAVWLTETNTDKPSISPYDIEFKLISYIYDFLSTEERRIVYIENLNYLVYTVGMERVVDFLHTLRSISQDRHVIIVSGKMEYLTEEEKKRILDLFDERMIVEWEDKITPPTVVLSDSLPKGKIFRIVDKKISSENMLFVSPQGTHPTRLDFEIFERISEAIKSGMDISIECLGTLIHYNDRRTVYIWLKAVSDYASKHGRRVYIFYTPIIEKDLEFFLDLVDEGKGGLYGGSHVSERSSVMFYEVIFSFLHNYSRRKPFILLVEDVQWVDTSSLELVHYLARNIEDSKIMIVLTYRSEELMENRSVLEILSKIQKERNVSLIRVKPLGRIDIEKMLRSMGFDVDFDSIYEASEGNPLLAINMARYFSTGERVRLPDTIRESIEMQVDSLDEMHLNFIRFLSVAGNEIPLELVEEFYPEYEFFLENMEKFFVRKVGNTLRFAYSPYREVVYRGISKDTRMELHRRIGEWAERHSALFIAAYHYYMAKEERAIKLLKMAADEAVGMLAFQSAIDYLQKAVEIARRYRKDEELGDIYTSLGEWYLAIGEYRKAVDAFENALKYSVNNVQIGTKLGTCYRLMGNLERAKEVLEGYLDEATGIDKARLIGELGIINWEMGDFSRALEKLREYLNQAERYGSEIDVIRATRNIASVYYMEGNYKKAMKYALRALKLAEDVGDIRELADTYNILGVINNHLTRYDEALKYLMKYLEISEKIGNMDYLFRAYNNIAVTFEKLGDINKAEEYYRRSLKIIEKLGNDRLLEGFYHNMGVLYTRHGNYLDGLDYIKKGYELSAKLNNKFGMCENLISLGEISIEIGRYLDAVDYLNRAVDIAKENSYITLQFASYVYLAKAYIFLEESKKARGYIELAYTLKKDIQEDYLLMDYYVINALYQMQFGSNDMGLKWIYRAKEVVSRIRDKINSLYIELLEAYLICSRDFNRAKKMFEYVISEFKELDYKTYIAESYYYYSLCLKGINKKRAREIMNKAKGIYLELALEEKVKMINKKLNEI